MKVKKKNKQKKNSKKTKFNGTPLSKNQYNRSIDLCRRLGSKNESLLPDFFVPISDVPSFTPPPPIKKEN